MVRIAITQFGLEANTFANGVTRVTDYNPEGFTPAAKSVELYAGTKTNLGGAYQGVEDIFWCKCPHCGKRLSHKYLHAEENCPHCRRPLDGN